MINRILTVGDASVRSDIVASLRRSAEDAEAEGSRFLARAYSEAAYSLEEHQRLHGADILLACESMDREHDLVRRGKDDPEESVQDREVYVAMEVRYKLAAAFLTEAVVMP